MRPSTEDRDVSVSDDAVSGRIRLDQRLVALGLVATRSKARDLVVRGAVLVDGAACLKPGQLVGPRATVSLADTLDDGELPTGAAHVSRGALKLLAALDRFSVSPAGRIALDIGASTGGFTQVLLERGAARVYAVDVGREQLAPIVRDDPRVSVLDRQDARTLDRALVPEVPGFITADVSFISLTRALPAVLALAAPDAVLVALVKPQFEAGRAAIGKSGIVKSREARAKALDNVTAWLSAQPGWRVLGTMTSPITGKGGNVEYLIAAINDAPVDRELRDD